MTITIAANSNGIVSLDDVKAHLRLLGAFSDLRRAQGGESQWPTYVEQCVAKFDIWMKKIEALSDQKPLCFLDHPECMPDLDVLLVWHTYMLNPLRYYHDGKTVSPALNKLSSFPLHAVAQDLETIKAARCAMATVLIDPEPSRSFDLAAAVLRQSAFISKVESLGWTKVPAEELLHRSIERYEEFLALMASNAVKCLVPTLDIDLVWHTHQLKGPSYREFTHQLLGHVLNHDDNIPDSGLTLSFAATEVAWKARTGVPYLQKRRNVEEVAGCGSGGCNGECGAMDASKCSPGGCNGGCGTALVEASYLGAWSGTCGSGKCGSCGTESPA